MSGSEGQSYLLGDADPELERLRVQHETWSEVTHAGWHEASLAKGEDVLDVGCGPGFTTLELAQEVGPGGSVVGLDPSPKFNGYLERAIKHSGHNNIQVIPGAIHDLATDRLFDFIHIRWVLCFLPDAEVALQKLAGLLKPGGRILTLDYFNYRAFAMAPRIPAMKTVVRAIGQSWTNSGGDLDVQGTTPGICEQAGLNVTHIQQISGVARPGEARFQWPADFLADYLPLLVEQGLLGQTTLNEFWDGWREREAAPGSFLYLPPMLRVIAQKP